MTDKKKLMELIANCHNYFYSEKYKGLEVYDAIAEYLIANGVTFATNTNAGSKWIPVSERLPEPFVPVLVQMFSGVPFPTVREVFISRDGIWHSALYHREPNVITHWMPLPEPPKEDDE